MKNSVNNIANKVVLITGASSGIGEATAKVLAQRGAKLVLGARRTDRLEKLAAEIRTAGGEAQFLQLDVSKAESVKSFVRFAQEHYGRVDVLVNNAGVMPLSTFDQLKTEEWDRMIDVNIKGVLNGIAATLPVFKAQGEGQYINIASIGAYQVWPTTGVYSATKYAVRAISDGLRMEVGKDIRVTVVSPGVVESELADTITDPNAAEAMKSFRAVALKSETIGNAIAYAIEQPRDVDVSELIVRPAGSY